MGNFWNLNPLANSSTMSGRLGSAMLPDFGNSGAHPIWILVPHGIKVFEGIAAPQLGKRGHWAPGGDRQYFIPKEVGVLLREATLTLLNGQTVHIALNELDLTGYERICASALAVQIKHWKDYRKYAKKLTLDVKQPSKEQRHQEFLLKEKMEPSERQTAKSLYEDALTDACSKLSLHETDSRCQRCGKKISETGGICKGVTFL